MLKVFLRLLLLVGVIVAIFWGIGSLLPRSFSIQQSVQIQAPIESVFAKVNDLHYWMDWSPWNSEILGADKIQIGEPVAGSGAKLFWDDPRGPGKLRLIDSVPNERISYEFDMGHFREIHGDFTFSGQDGGTQVTWTCVGNLPSGPFYGFFGFFVHSGLSQQFQASLQRLKKRCEQTEAPKNTVPK